MYMCTLKLKMASNARMCMYTESLKIENTVVSNDWDITATGSQIMLQIIQPMHPNLWRDHLVQPVLLEYKFCTCSVHVQFCTNRDAISIFLEVPGPMDPPLPPPPRMRAETTLRSNVFSAMSKSLWKLNFLRVQFPSGNSFKIKTYRYEWNERENTRISRVQAPTSHL